MNITGTKEEKQLIVKMCDIVLKAGGLSNMQAVQVVLNSIGDSDELPEVVGNIGGAKDKAEDSEQGAEEGS